MDKRLAQKIIEDALGDSHGAEITTAPTEEQDAALRALAGSGDIAPRMLCDTLDMPQGSTWGQLVDEINRDRIDQE